VAQPALEKFNRRVLAVAAAGVTVAAATHAIKFYEGSSGTEFDKVEDNEDKAVLGGSTFAVTNKRAFIEGQIHFALPEVPGSTTGTEGVAPHAPVLKPCGLAETISAVLETTRYTPVSSSFALADAKFWHSGDLIEVTNARGNLTSIGVEVNQRPSAQLRLQGSYDTVDEAALPNDANTSAFVQMRPGVGSSDATRNTLRMRLSSLGVAAISNLALRAKSLRVDLGNTIETKPYSEFDETGVSARVPTFTAVFARPSQTDFDVHAIRDSEELITLAMRQVDLGDGRYLTIGVRGQIDQITATEVQGDKCWQITGTCIPSDAGGDEFYLEFGNATFRIGGDIADQDGEESVAYSWEDYLALGDYVGTLTWAISAGALPAGLTIDSGTGVISGTPDAATAGTHNFTVSATDSTPVTPKVATKAQVLTITA
jgi:hypothetical protein